MRFLKQSILLWDTKKTLASKTPSTYKIILCWVYVYDRVEEEEDNSQNQNEHLRQKQNKWDSCLLATAPLPFWDYIAIIASLCIVYFVVKFFRIFRGWQSSNIKLDWIVCRVTQSRESIYFSARVRLLNNCSTSDGNFYSFY